MKVVILAGGVGSRISEESVFKPKPMIEIGDKPILWHIMKIYSFYGFNDFVILCGYKGYLIKEYFTNYYKHMSDLTVDLSDNSISYHKNHAEPWKVTLVDTGLETNTGGRIKRAKEYIGNETFMLTYGDGVADINLAELLDFHQKNKKLLTMTSVQPEGRFGALVMDENQKVDSFQEKPKGDGAWINGGFFLCEPEIMNFIEADETIFEKDPLEKMAKEGQIYAYKHLGFWKPMDTLRDKIQLDGYIAKNNAPWIKW